MKKILFISLLSLALGASACGDKKTDAGVEDLGRAGAPAAAAPSAPAAQGTQGRIHEGTIMETMDAASYTYIKFQATEGPELWAAVFKGTFEVGKSIAIAESVIMKDFHSGTLEKTFPVIIFGGVVGYDGKKMEPSADPRGAGDMKMPAGHPPMGGGGGDMKMPAGHPPMGDKKPEGHPPVDGAHADAPTAPVAAPEETAPAKEAAAPAKK